MYANSNVASAASVTAGVAVLPNTGGNELLIVASLVGIVTGGVILLSTLARLVAKRVYGA